MKSQIYLVALIAGLLLTQQVIAQTSKEESFAVLIEPSHPNCYVTRIDNRRPGVFSGKLHKLSPGPHSINVRTTVYQFTGGGIRKLDYNLQPGKTYKIECELDFENLSYTWRAWLVDTSNNETVAIAVPIE